MHICPHVANADLASTVDFPSSTTVVSLEIATSVHGLVPGGNYSTKYSRSVHGLCFLRSIGCNACRFEPRERDACLINLASEMHAAIFFKGLIVFKYETEGGR